jgi:hypothetical protein
MGAGGIQGRWIAAMAAAGTRGFTGLAEAAQRFEHLLFVPQALGIGGLLQLLPVAPHQVAQRQTVAGPQPGRGGGFGSARSRSGRYRRIAVAADQQQADRY